MLQFELPLISQLEYTEEFPTRLRLQWIRMLQERPNPLTVQLLSSKDFENIAPEDCIDLVGDDQLRSLAVKDTTHKDISNLKGDARMRFEEAMTLPADKIGTLPVFEETERFRNLKQKNHSVTDVVFILHGIRDPSFWPARVANEILELNGNGRSVKTHTVSYGIFTAEDFLTLTEHDKKIAWFADQYAELKVRFPNAKIHFVGHSFGTLAFTEALKRYDAMQFGRVVFAGSVVRNDLNWADLNFTVSSMGDDAQEPTPRLGPILNLVANNDWVVALFPGAFQNPSSVFRLIPGYRSFGNAGYKGFTKNDINVANREVDGDHGAAIQEEYWSAIGKFILDGEIDSSLRQQKATQAGSLNNFVLATVEGTPRSLRAFIITVFVVRTFPKILKLPPLDLMWIPLDDTKQLVQMLDFGDVHIGEMMVQFGLRNLVAFSLSAFLVWRIRKFGTAAFGDTPTLLSISGLLAFSLLHILEILEFTTPSNDLTWISNWLQRHDIEQLILKLHIGDWQIGKCMLQLLDFGGSFGVPEFLGVTVFLFLLSNVPGFAAAAFGDTPIWLSLSVLFAFFVSNRERVRISRLRNSNRALHSSSPLNDLPYLSPQILFSLVDCYCSFESDDALTSPLADPLC